MNWLRPHRPSPALVISVIALILALGGTGYAAITLPKNSVGAKQLRKNSVTGPKLKKNAVSSAKVRDGSLLAADFKAGQLPAGPKGPAGPQGLKGDTGAAGAPGVSGYEIAQTSDSLAGGETKKVVATCPTGKTVLGGGYSGVGNLLETSESHPAGPVPGVNQWVVVAKNAQVSSTGLVVYAICGNVG
jgi:hypothetical protein